MKKLIYILFCLCTLSLSANTRSASEAAKIAAKKSHVALSKLDLAYTQLQQSSNTPAFYIFNKGKQNGYVLMAADDQIDCILGYADEGSFDSDNIPENMRVWFEHYAEEIATISKTGASPRKTIASTAITPLLGKDGIMWNQGDPYNVACPFDSDSKRCVTGCVATAVGQIMRYWKYPEHGIGSHSYAWTKTDKSVDTLFVDFSQTTYDWANMLGTYKNGFNSAQKNAVSTLLYHIGVSCEMEYGSKSSGAQTPNALMAMISHFNYDPSMYSIMPTSYGEEEFEAAITNELLENRPVLISGSKAGGGAHAFVCDGKDTNGLFHINWGWGGTSNGYFAMTALDPKSEGIGGSSAKGGYNVKVAAKLNIKPNANGTRTPNTITARHITLNSASSIKREELISIYIDTIDNSGLDTFNGYFGIGIFKDGQYVNKLAYKKISSFKPSYFYPTTKLEGFLPNSITEGTYTLMPIYTLAYSWLHPISIPIDRIGDYSFTMTVTNTNITIEPQQGTSFDITPHTLNVDEDSNGASHFSWTARDLVSKYLFKLWNANGDTIVSSILEPSTSLTYDYTLQIADAGVYYWSVNGIMANGTICKTAYGKAFTVKGTTYTISNLKIDKSEKGTNWRDFSWNCTMPPSKYVFWLQNKQSEAVEIDTITTPYISKELTISGKYLWGVAALDSKNEVKAHLDASEFSFTFDTTYYLIADLKVESSEQGPFWKQFFWSCTNMPDKFVLWTQNISSEIVEADTIPTTNTYLKEFAKEGTYNWGLIAIDIHQHQVFSAKGPSFTITKDTADTKLETIEQRPILLAHTQSLEIMGKDNAQVFIYDISGKLVKQTAIFGRKKAIIALNTGAYIVRITNYNTNFKVVIP